MNCHKCCCSPFFLLAMMTLTLVHHQRPVNAFELNRMVFSNATKNRLMMPLRLDDRLIASRRATEKDSYGEVMPSPPRGIVLNTAVGGLAFAGGLVGFVAKGSKASLTAGSIFGGLLMFSALLISKSSESKSAKGNVLGFSVSGMLGYVMGKKFLVSKKFMPAGLLASLSAIGFVYNLIEAKLLFSSKQPPEEGISPSMIDTDKSDSTE